jgi:hypothetical protein
MEQQSLFIRISIPNRLEHDLDIVYDDKKDKMIFTWCEGSKLYLPCIFSIPSYVVGYIKGKLGNKGFLKFKKDLINAVTKDYKSNLFYSDNCNTNRLLKDYSITF